MALDIEKELKIWWLCGIIVMLIFGLWYFISVDTLAALFNYPYLAPVTGRVIGGVYLAWAIIFIRLYKERDNWEKIENWVLFSLIVQILTIITNIIGLIAFNLTIGNTFLPLIINVLFVIVGIHIWIQKRK
jgi:hypothetical protein